MRRVADFGPGLDAFERAITLELARGGEVGPEGFRWLRKAAGLKAVRLAELLEVTPMQGVALGEQPQAARTASGRLGLRPALEQGEGKAATRAVLEALAARKKVPRTVQLDVNAAS